MRSVSAIVLVILAAISISTATVGYWVHDTVLDTDAMMEIVEPAITSPEFTNALSIRLSGEVVETLDLETRLETRLSALDQYIGEQLVEALDPDPAILAIIRRLDVPRFADLAAPISTAANEQITETIDSLIESEEFQSVLIASMRRAHEAAVDLVTEGVESFENVYVADGQVIWNAIPLVVHTIERVIEEGILQGEELTLPDLTDNPVASEAIFRLRAALGEQIPDNFGQVQVMSEDDYLAAQDAGRAFDRAVWVLILTSVVLIAATLWVSPQRRRTTVQLGLGTVIALVLSAIAIQASVEAVQEGITNPNGQEAARVVLSEVADSLRSIWIVVTATARVVGIVAYLAGRPHWVEKGVASGRQLVEQQGEPSGLDRFVARYFDILTLVLVGLGLLVLWLTGLHLVWFLIILALVGGFVWFGQSARQRVETSESDVEEAADADAELPR